MWKCVICGSDKQPTCSIPSYKRFVRKHVKKLVRNAKTCSEVCRHENKRRMSALLTREREAARERRNAASEIIGDKGQHDDCVDG